MKKYLLMGIVVLGVVVLATWFFKSSSTKTKTIQAEVLVPTLSPETDPAAVANPVTTRVVDKTPVPTAVATITVPKVTIDPRADPMKIVKP